MLRVGPKRGVYPPGMLLLALACTDKPSEDTAPASGSFRVAFVADTHIIGPQYTEPSENGELDNASIMKTVERAEATVAAINAIEPPVEMVFVLGDVVHDSYHSEELGWFEDNETGFTRAQDILGKLDAPVYPIWGNHDYELDCSGGGWSREFSHQLFATLFDAEPWFAVDHGGWRFIAANSMLGPTWAPGDLRCDTGKASYGREQLAWMAEQLDEGKPTVWMAHYMLPLITEKDEDPEGPYPDVFSVLEGRDNLAMALVGHTHRWLAQENYDFPHYVVAATRYDADNFWVVEFNTDGSYRILDQDKALWFTTCADTWTYAGDPALSADNQELGDCGY